MDELIHVHKKFKNNRSPGPDGIPIEFFKLLNADELKCTLELLNNCWNEEVMPDEFELAEVVTLYKKRKCRTPRKLKANSASQHVVQDIRQHITTKTRQGRN